MFYPGLAGEYLGLVDYANDLYPGDYIGYLDKIVYTMGKNKYLSFSFVLISTIYFSHRYRLEIEILDLV